MVVMRLAVFFSLLVFAGTSQAQEMQWENYAPVSTLVVDGGPVTSAKYPFVDAHGHLWGMSRRSAEEVKAIAAEMDALNMAVLVNLSGGSGETLAQNVRNAEVHAPGRIVHFANVDFNRIDEENFGPNAAAQLEEDFNNGAVGLKIFKNLGMSVFDAAGNRLETDDPRLDPIWAKCGELGIPVLIHTADPAQFWLPQDRFNERWFELKERPNRKRPAEPTWEELIEEQWNVFRKHPETRFINAHLGWYGNNLGKLGELFDEYPNVYTELGAVVAEFGRQPHTARQFMIDYQDRVLMGKDSWNPEEYHTYFRVFETADEFFPYYRKRHAWWMMYGLDLPDEVLRKVYYKNALAIIPGIDTSRILSDWDAGYVDAPETRPSPMMLARTDILDTYVKVHYSSPRKRGREIFGDLVPYGEIWRTAANEATEITLTGDIQVGGQVLPAGTYSIFSIPGETSWTIIFNKSLGLNGTAAYSEANDVLRVSVPSQHTDTVHEAFTIAFEPGDARADMVFTWDRTRVAVALSAP